MSSDDKLVIQILDWDYFHEEDDEGVKKFCIRLFGKTKAQKSVYLQIDNFKPYFYVEINENWRLSAVDSIMEAVKRVISKEHLAGLINKKLEEKYKFWGFTNYKKFQYLKLTFNDFDSMKAYARAFTYSYKIFMLSKKRITFKLYESNILPIFRFMHTKQLDAVGWISINKENLVEYEYPPTCCDINYKTLWTNVEKVDDRLIEKFIIASFDIECKSEDGSFPQPQRENDKVIQIGITMSRFGESECYYKHLLSLKKTSDIEGATVEWFHTEEDLLLGFTKIIRKLNPDIITGYNIFGFDFNYLMERSKKLEISHKFSRLSRVNNEMSEWVEAGLSSAALGTNILKYYKMTGRVIIDLMKVVQRDYKLSSYKLDSVASYFIRETILTIEPDSKNDTFKILTKGTFGLYKNQYISIVYVDGVVENKYNEGQKFQVMDFGKDYIIVKGKIDTSEFVGKGFKIFWCQAKDDITPNDIFRMCDGTADERSEIGAYCLQDCNLCNKLIAKLQIITNNVSMANVCHVPLSYLFLRGQGVKIFSLVSKKCREKNHVIPVIKKKVKKIDDPLAIKKEKEIEKKDNSLDKFINALNNKHADGDEDDDDSVGYEGAKVFVPVPGVYYEPISVLDFASLYPNSMIFRNFSHECLVNNAEYDNLPGYKYHTVSYKNNDNTETICRFAEKEDGTKGIIPEILMDLLSARKKYKKLKEEETDPFKKSILDSLQNAYKVTANSLYGQTGASTSPICMKEIAASTTATGREMLLFSKYFIENIYADMLLTALKDKNEFLVKANQYYQYYPTNFSVDDWEIDEKTEKRVKITHNIHVCTDKKSKIPDSKFSRWEIGYEIDTPFYDDAKKSSKFYDDYKQYFEKMGFTNPQEFDEKFNKVLVGSSVKDRLTFYKGLKELIIDEMKKKSTFLEKNNVLLEKMGVDRDIFYDQLKQLQKSEQKVNFMKVIEDNIKNMGYKNKDDMFETFYNMVNDVLKDHEIKPEIIYGDSVTGDTPLLLREETSDGSYQIIIRTIETLGNNWKNYGIAKDEKFHDDNISYYIWSEIGWTKIQRVIKHKTSKSIYNILTHTGFVNVTEDHSLLSQNNTPITPKECELGTTLLHSFPDCTTKNTEQKLGTVKSYIYGFFMGSNYDNSNSNDMDLLYDSEKHKIVPRDVLSGTMSEKEAYLEGFNDANCNEPYIFDQKSQITAMNIYLLLKSMGYNVSINNRNDKDDIFTLTYTKNTQRRNNIAIKKITKACDIKEQWVYDLETENHHFQAGVGEIIVHNTDSVFYKMNVTNKETHNKLKNKQELIMCINLGIWASIMISTMLPPPMAQEYEKVLWPFIIQGKKRYVGNLYEKNPNKFSQKSMGIELKRRDNAPIVKTVCAGIIDQILNKHSSEGAYKFTKETLQKIVTGKYKMDKFIITKTLKGNALTTDERRLEKAKPKEQRSYADRTTIVHAVLADRMADRDPGNKPLSNDRIPYVYIETKVEPKLQGERVETPEYIIQNKLKIDYLFYITNQIMKPSLKFLDLIIENAENIFKEYIIREENRKKCMMPIAYYAKEDIDKNGKDFIDFDNLPTYTPSKEIKEARKKTVKKKINNFMDESETSMNLKCLIEKNYIVEKEKKKVVSKKKQSNKSNQSDSSNDNISINLKSLM